MLYLMVEMYKCFGEICCLHLQGRILYFIIAAAAKTSISNSMKSRRDKMKSNFHTQRKDKGHPITRLCRRREEAHV